LFIDISLIKNLISNQFPKWKKLSTYPVESSGWDNKTFHLGDKILLRMPSAEEYKLQIEKEHTWLPKHAPILPLAIPEPIVTTQVTT
jgi:aminoglycoside phosphotransferase (APT) family kinase protein